MSDRRHMSDLIPFVLQQEQAKIKGEIEGHHVSIIFDGTTHLALLCVDQLFLMKLSHVRGKQFSKCKSRLSAMPRRNMLLKTAVTERKSLLVYSEKSTPILVLEDLK